MEKLLLSRKKDQIKKHYLPMSGPLGAPEAQMPWLGHPAQADDFPASSLPVPGQSEIELNRKLLLICHTTIIYFLYQAYLQVIDLVTI